MPIFKLSNVQQYITYFKNLNYRDKEELFELFIEMFNKRFVVQQLLKNNFFVLTLLTEM